MAFVVRFVKGVRNHWKKSTFAAVALTYGINYAKEYIEIQQLMHEYCVKAATYGNEPILPNENPRNVTIILNPNANKRKAAKEFEKYCAPILHLAGICVDIVQTESEGHAKKLMEELKSTDAVVVAGGDGTLSEVVTGLLRIHGVNNVNLPIGVLPLGKSNTIGKSLFPGGEHLTQVRSLADASMAVIERFTRPIDVMKIEIIDDEESQGKAVYAVSAVEWGAYRDAQAKKDKYWYFGPFRNYVTYIFNGYKDSLNWNCQANINYTLPCEGCIHCIKNNQNQVGGTRWYHKFLPYRTRKQATVTRVNDKCQEIHEKEISTLDLSLATTNTLTSLHDLPKLQLNLGPDSIDYLDFVKQGWESENGKSRNMTEVIEAKQIEIKPTVISSDENEKWFSIDKEDFEVKPVRITLLPKAVQMFCKKSNSVNVAM
ncbi:hypothetical protein ILUMI_09236 [Ignelater luminosus]|uniref:Acylglycerol kinase, mitochondrial n=1 Tax=Ignelater luminosus TaxID=2038154 RepID=A0A8K0D4N0_IGNLU|nr:hypothetical protein ILUMI_09236 [Ignelater luminosus]